MTDSHGALEAKVREDIANLGESPHRMHAALSELCYSLARRLDGGDEKSTAQVAKELRLTLAELAAGAPGEDDPLGDELSDPE